MKGTIDFGFVFDRSKTSSYDVYVDSDYGGDLDKRMSISGYIFTLSGSAIFWKASLQSITALSTIEALYISATEGVKEGLLLNGLVLELAISQGSIIVISDSQSTIHLIMTMHFILRLSISP